MRMMGLALVSMCFWGILITLIIVVSIYLSDRSQNKNVNGFPYFYATLGVIATILIIAFITFNVGLKKEIEHNKAQVKQDITILSDKRYDADFFDNTMSSRDMTVKEIKWTHGSGSIEISEDRNYFTVTGSGEVEIEFLGGFYDGQSRTGHYYVSEVN